MWPLLIPILPHITACGSRCTCVWQMRDVCSAFGLR